MIKNCIRRFVLFTLYINKNNMVNANLGKSFQIRFSPNPPKPVKKSVHFHNQPVVPKWLLFQTTKYQNKKHLL
jgi:hypothetical protein